MENIKKSQFIILLILVVLVTSLTTGVLTASLLGTPPNVIKDSLQKAVSSLTTKNNGALAQLDGNSSTEENMIVSAVERVSPAVVSIIATKNLPVLEEYYGDPFGGNDLFRQFFPQFQFPQYRERGTQRQQIGSGSGFFVTDNGYIITNRHVVDDTQAEYTVITNSGARHKASVVARDPIHDLAILKIDGSNYPTVTLGDSNSIKIGQTAIAIGNALGEFQNTVSVGVISGQHRTITAGGRGAQTEELRQVIQTDAAINPGNSGGPLLNSRGEVIGINTAMAGGAENIGFALPVNLAKKDLESIKANGKITYPFLGIQYVIITPEVKQSRNLSVDYGALLTPGNNGGSAIVPGSPAEKAGLRNGDIILELDGTRITKDRSLAELIEEHKVGDTVRLKVLRDGKELDINVILSERNQ